MQEKERCGGGKGRCRGGGGRAGVGGEIGWQERKENRMTERDGRSARWIDKGEEVAVISRLGGQTRSYLPTYFVRSSGCRHRTKSGTLAGI